MQIFNSIAIGGGKNRQSNLEALRLLSMLMVLNLHSFWGYNHGSGLGQFIDFFRESTSICAVDVFILISGYFGIKWKSKGLFNLLFQCVFYSFAVYAIALALGFIDFELKTFLKCFGCFFLSLGFITNYIVLYVISPLINKYSENVSSKNLLVFIIVLFVAENTICFTTGILNFILFYMVGRFLRKTNVVEHVIASSMWRGYLICTVIITLLAYGFCILTPINNAQLMTMFPLGYSYGSPFIILQAVFIFLAFAKMTFTNKYINWCASSCLAIFLIHMHPAIKQIGYYSYTESLYDLPVGSHILYLVLLIAGVFFGAILIDKIRILISEFVYSVLCKIASCLPQQAISINTYIPGQINNLL